MKKVNLFKVLMAITAVLAFLFLGVEQANAQVNTLVGTGPSASGTNAKALMATPQGNFVSVDDAQILIAQKLEEIKLDMLVLGLPQSALNALEKKFEFYHLIDKQLKTGNSVPNAIIIAAVTITTDVFGVANSVALALKQEAVDLLKI